MHTLPSGHICKHRGHRQVHGLRCGDGGPDPRRNQLLHVPTWHALRQCRHLRALPGRNLWVGWECLPGLPKGHLRAHHG